MTWSEAAFLGFAWNLIGLAAITLWTTVLCFLMFFGLKSIDMLRVETEHEFKGETHKSGDALARDSSIHLSANNRHGYAQARRVGLSRGRLGGAAVHEGRGRDPLAGGLKTELLYLLCRKSPCIVQLYSHSHRIGNNKRFPCIRLE